MKPISLALLVATALWPTPALAQPTCFGEPATKVGTSGPDRIEGTSGNDVIVGRGGGDEIDGLGGDDLICGGGGEDFLRGGEGNDDLDGGDYVNYLSGGPGDDLLDGGEDGEAYYRDAAAGVEVDLTAGTATGEGTDTLTGITAVTGSAFADRIRGNEARNWVAAGPGDDFVHGEGESDHLEGGDGADRIEGGPGFENNLIGGDGPDILIGGGGADLLQSGPGADSIEGSGGDDYVSPGGDQDDDAIDGGEGSDRVVYADSDRAMTVDLAADLAEGQGTDTLASIERAVGSKHDDRLLGDDEDNHFSPGLGDDYIDGAAGSDTLNYFDSGGIVLDLAAGAATGEGTDTIQGVENAIGSWDGHDVLKGDDGPNLLADGQDGDDKLVGRGGDDHLIGRRDDDVLRGGAGTDVLSGGIGRDRCRGGEQVRGCEVA